MNAMNEIKETLRRISGVCLREFSSSAASPTAWVFLVIFLVLSAFCSFIASGVFASGQADLSAFFDWMPWLFLFIVPALGMPLWADERRSGVFELTLSFPARLWELVAGKYLAGMLLLTTAVLLTASTPLTALYLGEPDLGAILCGYAGTLLTGSVFLSVSCFCSSLSRSQTASFLLSLLLCGILMFIGWPELNDFLLPYLPQSVMDMISFCAILPHYQAFQRGILDSGEVIYCAASTLLFLYLTGTSLKFASAGIGNLFAPGTLREASTGRMLRKVLISSLLAFYAFFCVNITASTFRLRFDLSSDRAYSLSPEARALAASLNTPATIRFYATKKGTKMPPALKKYAERVEWLLNEFRNASDGKLSLQLLDPEPDSPDEEAALLEGVKPLPLNTGERVFLGLSVSCADRTVPIPFLSPQQEKTLEYEIARAALNVTRKEKPVVGVLSSLPVMGDLHPQQAGTVRAAGSADPDGQQKKNQPERPWYAINELARDMNVLPLSPDVSEIPGNVSALLIIQPCALPRKTLYAIDQYLLRGGRLAVYLDPRSLYSILKTRQDFSYMERTESDLEPLLSAWGLAYNKTLMAADMNFALRVSRPDRNITNPLALKLTADAISKESPLTASLNSVSLYFSAVLPVVREVEGLHYETLLQTSENSQIVSALIDRPELVIRHFTPSGIRYPLALRISGIFPGAFPSGPPDAVVPDAENKHLRSSARPSEVILFGDSDMIFNDACVRTVQDALGQTSLIRQDDNLALFQNVMDHLCGSSSLSAIRGRVPMSRPLTRINEIKARAELAYKDRILSLQRNLAEAQNRVRRIQDYLTASGGEARLSEEQKREIREYSSRVAEFKRELKELNLQLKADLDRLDNLVRGVNLILVPLLVAVAGILWSAVRLSKWRKRK